MVVLFMPAYTDTAGHMRRFTIHEDGDVLSDQGPVPGRCVRSEGIFDGMEPIPLYCRTLAVPQGAASYLAVPRNSAGQLNLQLINENARLPAMGEWLWGWWPQTARFPAGFYRGVIILKLQSLTMQ